MDPGLLRTCGLVTATVAIVVAAAIAQTDADETAVAIARETLLEDQPLEAATISLVRVEEATWPDTSLGCPVRGLSYLPVLTAGHRVTLEAAGETYRVHVAGKLAVVCRAADPAAPSPPAPREPAARGSDSSRWPAMPSRRPTTCPRTRSR